MAASHSPSHSQQSYISPSDTIMSPTTKKLSEMKGKRFASGKAQSLFAKTVGKQALKNQDRDQSRNQDGEDKPGHSSQGEEAKENVEATTTAAAAAAAAEFGDVKDV